VIPGWLRGWLEHWKSDSAGLRMQEQQRFLLLSIFIGVLAGLLVVCFHVAIDFLHWWSLGVPAGESVARTLLAPALGGLAASSLILRVFRKARGSGVNQTKAAIYVSEGHVPFSSVIGKFLACSVSIGSGNSLGPEDPALQMGAGIASRLGRAFQLSRATMRMIAPVGAAAGIAAAFNTPITGVIFVTEEVIGNWRAGVLGSIVLAAVSAVVVHRSFLGNEPLFHVPPFELSHSSELLVYALIGTLGGLLSAAFVRMVESLHHLQRHVPAAYREARPFVAGLLVGGIGLYLPQVMGAGYEAINSALHNRFPWEMLLALCLAKIVATLLCFSAGTPGGMFAPTLFVGAMLGGGLGALNNLYAPFPTGPSGAYVLVGMATFFAGVFRAPLTAVFMVFEVSASYVIILPVMIASTLSYLVSRAIQPTPFFQLIARHEGLELPSSEDLRDQPLLRVEDAMNRELPAVINGFSSAESAWQRLEHNPVQDVLVTIDFRDWAVVRRSDVERAVKMDGQGNRRLEDLFPLEPFPRLYPDLPLDQALRVMSRRELLPVVSRADQRTLLGTICLADVHRAYGIAGKLLGTPQAEVPTDVTASAADREQPKS
jgi:chloride channel protein, CIC family